jgi:hypothetical protein
MAVSTIGVADADTPDKYIHTNARTISATSREDQFVLLGEPAYPTYTIALSGISVATSAAHVLQVMGDGTNYTRLLRIKVVPGYATSAAASSISIVRLSTAGTGGTSRTPSPHDTADTYAGGAMTLPSSKGTEAATLLDFSSLWFPASATGAQQFAQEWLAPPRGKPIILGTATSSGIALKVGTGLSGGTIGFEVTFSTSSYL